MLLFTGMNDKYDSFRVSSRCCN